MQDFDFSKIKEFDIAFTNKNDFISRGIRFFEAIGGIKNFFGNFGKALKAATDDTIPSHVFLFNCPVPGRFFAAEMVDRGIETDNSIKKNYLENSKMKIVAVKHVVEMDTDESRRVASNLLYEYKDFELKYGWEKLLGQMGLPYKETTNTEICSGLVARIYAAIGVDFGRQPSSLEIMRSPIGTLTIY